MVEEKSVSTHRRDAGPRHKRAFDVLAAVFLVALPAFLFVSIIKMSKRVGYGNAVKSDLMAIYVRQAAYFSEHNTYAGGEQCFDLLGWEPQAEHRYSFRCGDSHLAANLEGSDDTPCAGARHASGRAAFTACASANLDEDEDIDIWTISDSKELLHPSGDVDVIDVILGN